MQVKEAVKFLHNAAKYFENRPTNGEDRTHWSNVQNAENCRKIANIIVQLDAYAAKYHDLMCQHELDRRGR
jgi:hypothetical protein